MEEKASNKRSVILLIIIIIFSLALSVAINMLSPKGKIAVITVNGETVKELPLSEDAEFVATGYEGGENKVIVKDGTCYVSYADCPDKLCVKQGKIIKEGESVICLPHRVVVTIMGADKSNELDSIAK
ncbi:NusG domain II-containing protein [Butyrivibrio sp. XPD2002]|uniref:NusG domain II-containing protein n=1 Tax=Butyrivibrio sp. XPD2002 TaxID=1280665 RepID=UPI00047D60D1|nr:NusG domain II-containing protein [Butyrivibrio sp. XPD2002]